MFQHRIRRAVTTAMVCLSIIGLAGCGDRTPAGQGEAQQTPAPGPAAAQSEPEGSLPPGGTSAPDAAAAAQEGRGGSTATRPGVPKSSPAGAPAQTNPAGNATRTDPATAQAPSRNEAASKPGSTPSPSSLPNPGGPGEAAAAKRTPVVIASVGTYTGPAAASLKAALDGAQLWVKYANQNGGLGGHPIKLVAYDDGGDPARHRAQVQDAVERQGALAFLMNGEELTGQGSVDYINAKRVPVIGTLSGVPWGYKSPMYFPLGAGADSFFEASIAAVADQLRPTETGKTKLALATCAEAQGCADGDRVFAQHASSLGYQVVYRVRPSIAQPDYTAECLGARNAGADTLMILLDSNSIRRMAASCSRQGYKPQFATAPSIIHESFKDDPNLANLVGSSNVFPWFQSNTPATAEYQQAIKTLGGSLSNGVGMAEAWTAGMILGKAGRNLPEPPTSAAILNGLWSMSADDIGGLTMPLTYVRDKPATPRACWFNLAVADKKWVSPDGFQRRCR